MDRIQRMEKELADLEELRGKGEDFIVTDTFSSLLVIDQRLLFAQFSAMETYSEILYARILRARELTNA